VIAATGSDVRGFATVFFHAVGQHRFWGRAQRERVPA
jgi:hypothetical protein